MAEHFGKLREARGDLPIYGLEHSFEGANLEALLRTVRRGLVHRRIESGWWEKHPLPLLVAATEVGYVYRGTGTDFWPIFTNKLGEASPSDGRQTLSTLFSSAAAEFQFAKPPKTPWNLAFRHIAWPVLHAILPIELQRPLARALRDVRAFLDVSGSDAALLSPIRNRAQLAGSVRLIAWLEDQRTAAAVVRYFLAPSLESSIAETALARIAADLARDETANVALREARQRQNALKTQPKQRTRRRTEPPLQFAPLVLRKVDQQLSLAVKIPQMEQGLRDRSRSVLDVIRWRAFLWSQGRQVPARNIFSDFPVAVSVDQLPADSVPLLGDVSILPIEQDARDFLGSLRAQTHAPLLFSDFGDDGDAIQYLSNAITDRSSCIVLVEFDQPPPGAEHLGRIAGMRGYRIDPAIPAIAQWLSNLGFQVRPSTRLTWVGDPEIEQHRPIRRFPIGSFVAFELDVTSGPREVLLTYPDGTNSSLDGEGNLLGGFTADQVGTYSFEYGINEELEFEVVDKADHLELISVDIDAATGATSDLAERQVTLRFNSAMAVQEAQVELALICGGTVINRVTDTLPDTPCRIAGDHPIWNALLNPEALERLLESPRAELGVVIAGLLEASFSFERVTAPFAWDHISNGILTANDESGPLDVFVTAPDRPLEPAMANDRSFNEDIRLFRAGHATPLQIGGLCLGPKIWRIASTAMAHKPERLLRQFERKRGSAADADAESVIDALIAWAAAGVDHPVTQFRRGQVVRQLERWMVEQLCGSEWANQEQVRDAKRGTSFVSGFLSACSRLSVGYADVALSRAQRALLDRILMRLIDHQQLPINLETSREPIDEDLAMALDGLFNEAYEVLSEEIELVGDTCPFDLDEDIDVGEPSDCWDQALRAAATEAAMIELVDLVRPLDAADTLSVADFETMLPDDIIDLLHEWIGKHRPIHHSRQWNRDLVEAAYWLFARPPVSARLSWKAASKRLLADSFSARAIRYAALRAGTTVAAE